MMESGLAGQWVVSISSFCFHVFHKKYFLENILETCPAN